LGAWPCRLWTMADVTLCTVEHSAHPFQLSRIPQASILNLCTISVDRYLCITRPFTYALGGHRSRRRILGYVLGVWAVALLVSAAPQLVLTREPLSVDRKCQVERS
jgi:hypothetical protein